MPPKESKNDEIRSTIDLVRSFWPDFVISSEHLENPTADFVVRFFTDFIIDVNEKEAYFLGENAVEQKEFDEVYLFCTVSRIFKRLKIETFCLNDIYRPVPLRTRFYVKSAVHYLIYITNEMQEWEKLINNPLKKAEEQNSMQLEINIQKEDISKNVEQVEKMKDEHQYFLSEKESVNDKYEKMLSEKHARDKVDSEKQLEIDKLSQEIEHEEYQLKCLEKEEADLKEQVVTTDDFEALQNIHESVKCELDKFAQHDDGLGDALDVQKENVDFIECCLQRIEKLNFDALWEKVQVLQEVNDLQKTHSNGNTELHEKIKELQSSVNEIKNEIDALNESLVSKESELHIVQVEIKEELKALKDRHDFQRKITLQKIKESEKLGKSISDLKENIKCIEEKTKQFKNMFDLEYHKVLDSQKDLLNTSCDIFNRIKLKSKGL